MVLRRINEIRRLKMKPSLKDMIMLSLKEKNKKDEKLRNVLKKKIIEIYENDDKNTFEMGDLWYNRVMINVDRILKILSSHVIAIDNIEKKLNKLT